MSSLFVPGVPAPQGSKSFKGIRGGKAILAESSSRVKPWRETIAWHTQDLTPVDGAVHVELEFVMPRPKSTPKSKPAPPAIKRNGDIDKLTRAVFDALSGRAYHDDAQVVSMIVRKRIAELDEVSGVFINVEEWSKV